MPRVPDKILINSGNFAAEAYAMKKAFSAGGTLGFEILTLDNHKLNGPLLKADADAHLAEQEAICNDLHKYMADCIARQRALNEKRRKWLDDQLDKLP